MKQKLLILRRWIAFRILPYDDTERIRELQKFHDFMFETLGPHFIKAIYIDKQPIEINEEKHWVN